MLKKFMEYKKFKKSIKQDFSKYINTDNEDLIKSLYGVYPGFPTKAVISDYKKACIT